jgi:hypothetical protein
MLLRDCFTCTCTRRCHSAVAIHWQLTCTSQTQLQPKHGDVTWRRQRTVCNCQQSHREASLTASGRRGSGQPGALAVTTMDILTLCHDTSNSDCLRASYSDMRFGAMYVRMRSSGGLHKTPTRPCSSPSRPEQAANQLDRMTAACKRASTCWTAHDNAGPDSGSEAASAEVQWRHAQPIQSR